MAVIRWPLSSTQVTRHLLRELRVFRKIDPDIQLQTLSVFLVVAAEPDIEMSRLAELCGISQASASRRVATLGKSHRKGQPGRDLLYSFEDPRERRRTLVRLTAKGEQVLRELTEANHGQAEAACRRYDQVVDLA